MITKPEKENINKIIWYLKDLIRNDDNTALHSIYSALDEFQETEEIKRLNRWNELIMTRSEKESIIGAYEVIDGYFEIFQDSPQQTEVPLNKTHALINKKIWEEVKDELKNFSTLESKSREIIDWSNTRHIFNKRQLNHLVTTNSLLDEYFQLTNSKNKKLRKAQNFNKGVDNMITNKQRNELTQMAKYLEELSKKERNNELERASYIIHNFWKENTNNDAEFVRQNISPQEVAVLTMAYNLIYTYLRKLSSGYPAANIKWEDFNQIRNDIETICRADRPEITDFVLNKDNSFTLTEKQGETLFMVHGIVSDIYDTLAYKGEALRSLWMMAEKLMHTNSNYGKSIY